MIKITDFEALKIILRDAEIPESHLYNDYEKADKTCVIRPYSIHLKIKEKCNRFQIQ